MSFKKWLRYSLYLPFFLFCTGNDAGDDDFNAPVLVDAGSDTTVSINDSIVLCGVVEPSFNAGSIVWYINGSDAASQTPDGVVRFKALPVPGTMSCVLSTTSSDGITRFDTATITVVLDPPIARAGKDTILQPGCQLHLWGSASTDKFGTIKLFEWRIGLVEAFIKVNTGDTSVFIGNERLTCLLRVTDDDNNITIDTITVFPDRFTDTTVSGSFGCRFTGTPVEVSISDTVHFPECPNTAPGGIRWTVRGGSFTGELSGPRPFFVAPHIEDSLVCTGIFTDSNGMQRTDTVVIAVRKDPPVADAGNDTTLWNGDLLHIDGCSSADRLGRTTRYLWDIGGSGKFTQVSACGDTVIPVIQPTFLCILRVFDDDGNFTDDTMKVKVNTNGSSMYGQRAEHAVTEFNGKIWSTGGLTYNGAWSSNDVWNTTDGITWNMVIDTADFSLRESHTLCAFNNRLWIIGGLEEHTHEYKNDVWQSENGVAWTIVTASAPFPPRYEHTTVVFGGKIWVIAGYNSSTVDNKQRRLADVWCSSDGADWVCVNNAAPFGPILGHASVVFNEKIWVIGGYGTTATNRIWNSSDGITWESVTSAGSELFPPRAYHAAKVFDGKIWVACGGTPSSFLSDVWYSSDGRQWNKIINAPPLEPRRGTAMGVLPDRLLIMCGFTDGRYLNDVWYLRKTATE